MGAGLGFVALDAGLVNPNQPAGTNPSKPSGANAQPQPTPSAGNQAGKKKK